MCGDGNDGRRVGGLSESLLNVTLSEALPPLGGRTESTDSGGFVAPHAP